MLGKFVKPTIKSNSRPDSLIILSNQKNFVILQKNIFMQDFNENIPLGLTYDDVLLVPAYSEVLPKDVDLTTYLTREIQLNIPIVSAAMDTVTEYQLAIAIAQEGGMGFLHKNMTIQSQCEQVRKVKRSESGLIVDPITLTLQSIPLQMLFL
ncbi:MAG: hypothetical protein KatS3mg035_1830 [Bacteroidia bacterium]|nr:MAG: hypothetical protein KatS3mg035_1830 [Bacteroidia bacterium]